MYLDKVKGLITEEEFIEFSREFHDEKNKIVKLITENEKQLTFLENSIKLAENRVKLVEKYMNVTKLEREHVDILIDCIYVGKRHPITKVIPIEIKWNF